MKNRSILSLTFFMCSILPEAQVRAQVDSARTNSITENAMALQFGIRNSFTLSTFQGASISLQQHTSATNAYRYGITLGGNFNNGTSSYSQIEADTLSTGSSSSSSSANSASIALDVQYLWYAPLRNEAFFYSGFGPHGQYNHSHSEQSLQYQPTDYVQAASNSSDANSWSLGISGLVGVEWFPARWLSLHADYEMVFQYRWLKTEMASSQTHSSPPYPYGTNSSSTLKQWELDNYGVNFGLSVYFQ